MDKERYHSIDWLRTIGCMGIVAMHVRANTSYDISGFLYNRIVLSFTDFVYLFMAVSSFGLCCGYYQKFIDGSIDLEKFYRKRYAKILPFFVVLILIDLCVSFSLDSLMQGLVEVTLFQGFIPVEFTVIGVGWFLGVVFIFYLLFPFFCVLLKNKRRGWLSFFIAIGLCFICEYYFQLDRHNFAYSFCYFFIGGLVFLYKDRIRSKKWHVFAVILVLSIVLYYLNINTITRSILTAAILSFAVSLDIRSFKPVAFISSISMEIYLCHMAVFRGLQRIHLTELFGNGAIQYLITYVAVFVGACAMSVMINALIKRCFIIFANRSRGFAN